ncbi:MAG: hypothetical protein AVDCRST_MAG33-579, partial [uncultured Thermomicrobiales bacterium]
GHGRDPDGFRIDGGTRGERQPTDQIGDHDRHRRRRGLRHPAADAQRDRGRAEGGRPATGDRCPDHHPHQRSRSL